MYVFGGCTQSSCNAAFNDLWRLDLNSKEWIRPLASGENLMVKIQQETGIFSLSLSSNHLTNVGRAVRGTITFVNIRCVKAAAQCSAPGWLVLYEPVCFCKIIFNLCKMYV